MLYMVEMELPDRSRLADWHAWYNAHIGKLLTVDGYDGGQRFEAVGPAESPFLAIHDVSGPELFTSTRLHLRRWPCRHRRMAHDHEQLASQRL